MVYPELPARLADVRARITAAKARAGRGDDLVTIVAVSKTHPVAAIEAARAAGLVNIGENRVAEMEGKVEAVGRGAVRWHLMGHLQRNKVRRALPLFDLLHSLDSARLAHALSEVGVELGARVHALAQVNTSGEASKSGFAAESVLDELGAICELPGLVIDGMMTMAPFTDEESVLRRTFARARELWDEAGSIPGFRKEHLSMGMSNDYEIAVEEGSTMVRLGTVLFGARQK